MGKAIKWTPEMSARNRKNEQGVKLTELDDFRLNEEVLVRDISENQWHKGIIVYFNRSVEDPTHVSIEVEYTNEDGKKCTGKVARSQLGIDVIKKPEELTELEGYHLNEEVNINPPNLRQWVRGEIKGFEKNDNYPNGALCVRYSYNGYDYEKLIDQAEIASRIKHFA